MAGGLRCNHPPWLGESTGDVLTDWFGKSDAHLATLKAGRIAGVPSGRSLAGAT